MQINLVSLFLINFRKFITYGEK